VVTTAPQALMGLMSKTCARMRVCVHCGRGGQQRETDYEQVLCGLWGVEVALW
jgi:hypothetical protein